MSDQNKKYFRIDEIKIKFINCPQGIKKLEECEKCPFHKGIKLLYPSHFVKCELYNDINDKL